MLKTNSQKRLQTFCTIAGLYMVLLTVLKVVEFFVIDVSATNYIQILVNAIVYNLVVASWATLGLGLLHWVIGLRWAKAADVIIAVIYAVMLFSEVGLTFYAVHNGFLLGCELVYRPLRESITAIIGAVGVVMPIVLPVVLIGGFIALSLILPKKATRVNMWIVTILCGTLMLMSLVFKMSHLVTTDYDKFIVNKTKHLIADIVKNIRNHSGYNEYSISYDAAQIDALHASHPEWANALDPLYPLERSTENDDFLSPLFRKTDTAPNIIIIIVESLGTEFTGNGIMPFIDSLASTGIYFPNCISTTPRSYGAMPAITGSVGGPKSFQFGTMPDHNSLFTLLQHAGYSTRAYYGGDYSFDCIYDYLKAQHIDYLAPFYDEARKSQNKWWWGAQDDYLFSHTLQDLDTLRGNHISVITTLSMHEELDLDNPDLQWKYEKRASRMTNKLVTSNLSSLCPSAIFTDDCLRRFFNDYRHNPDFANTIFVITGDHASGKVDGDKLSYHHVPLIIWSPLANKPMRYPHIVTHNDIAPAIYSLLTNRYGIPAYPYVHWIGDGLSPTHKTLLVVNYYHDIHDIIYHNYYYEDNEKLYLFDTCMKLMPCDNPAMLDTCRQQLDLMRYLYTYTYCANRLTAHPIHPNHYDVVRHIAPADIQCCHPSTPPPKGIRKYTILSPIALHNTEGYSTVRVSLEAEVDVNDDLSMVQYPKLNFIFSDTNTIYQTDYLSKYFIENTSSRPGTYHLAATHEFPINNSTGNIISIELSTPDEEEYFRPDICLFIKGININLSYGK